MEPNPGSTEEQVEIVDEHDVVIATVSREQMRRENLRHRGVGIVLIDREDRLLVHQRAATKDVWPSYWDLAAGGVVSAGETYESAAPRELAEELGVTDIPLEHLGGGAFADAAVSVLAQVYLAFYDGPVRFTDGEVTEARWVNPLEFNDLRRQFAFCPDSIAIILPLIGRRLPSWDGTGETIG
jgi:isopentenyldiphosphate isomerase